MKVLHNISKYILILVLSFGVMANAFSISNTFEVDEDSLFIEEGVSTDEEKSFFDFLLNFLEDQDEDQERDGEEDDNLDEEIEIEEFQLHANRLSYSDLSVVHTTNKSEYSYKSASYPKKYLLYQHLKIYC